MVEQLKYDVVSGIWHHKKRMLILVAVIIGIYIFMAVTCHGFLTSQEYIKILFRIFFVKLDTLFRFTISIA